MAGISIGHNLYELDMPDSLFKFIRNYVDLLKAGFVPDVKYCGERVFVSGQAVLSPLLLDQPYWGHISFITDEERPFDRNYSYRQHVNKDLYDLLVDASSPSEHIQIIMSDFLAYLSVGSRHTTHSMKMIGRSVETSKMLVYKDHISNHYSSSVYKKMRRIYLPDYNNSDKAYNGGTLILSDKWPDIVKHRERSAFAFTQKLNPKAKMSLSSVITFSKNGSEAMEKFVKSDSDTKNGIVVCYMLKWCMGFEDRTDYQLYWLYKDGILGAISKYLPHYMVDHFFNNCRQIIDLVQNNLK